ncbi:hemerythrin domain-containing protein [Tepidimonas sp.]|uniref:hemerythrin domain-containing protein n=1 Tax=Tepidimonas sp. TaxID=2002775 RepID=UPI00391B62E2
MTGAIPVGGRAEPQADHEHPFEWLRACHDRVERTLDLLQRLVAHVEVHGVDTQAAQAAAQVQRYFDQAAPLHHEDEELHVFSRVLALGDARLDAMVKRLQADHAAMADDWAHLRSVLSRLQAAVGDAGWRWSSDDRQCLARFVQRYESHIATEEGEVFVAAEHAMAAADRAAMAEDMRVRRAIASPTTVGVPLKSPQVRR